ncbi:MAG: [FeFe] hydrogenase H-cluster maturation GTPase HydF [Bacteroidales bacterium]|nr:[FeFe] hydrogenase H-cluster maturation GTPase HydF [Bacteroidales bacterium]
MAKELSIHIGIFGRRNFGKSSFINAIAGQDIAIISEVAGTTTDPVKKSLEIHGIGATVMIDTAGLDDIGELGRKRIEKSLAVIDSIDVAILILSENTFGDIERSLVKTFTEKDIPFLLVYNKVDVCRPEEFFIKKVETETGKKMLLFSSREPDVQAFVDALKRIMPETRYNDNDMFMGLIRSGDLVVLVTPIDSAAPEGRMILPQVQAIRNILDHDAINVVCKETELRKVLEEYRIKPALVVTDSQAFKYVSSVVSEEIPLTSFSILLARLKGCFDKYLEGTPTISKLQDGDRILILESCTHHATCEDIGRVKIPKLLSQFTGKELEFTVVPGLDEIPGDIGCYSMVIQCGGCVITRKQLESRLRKAIELGVPVSNYGMTISYVTGVFQRAVKVMQGR